MFIGINFVADKFLRPSTNQELTVTSDPERLEKLQLSLTETAPLTLSCDDLDLLFNHEWLSLSTKPWIDFEPSPEGLVATVLVNFDNLGQEIPFCQGKEFYSKSEVQILKNQEGLSVSLTNTNVNGNPLTQEEQNQLNQSLQNLSVDETSDHWIHSYNLIETAPGVLILSP